MTNGWDQEADVVVLGMGAAGCAAAISAADAGASVILLEKMPDGREGGNTRISGGIWYNSLDRDGMATYLRSLCGPYTLPEEIIEVWADETYKNTEWLESLGVTPGVHADYKPEYPEMPGAEFYGGYLGVNGEMGQQLLWKALSAAVRDRGVEVLLDTPAKELVTDDDGSVVGVVASSGGQPLRVGARRGVVLATGGFENNPEMVRDYLQLPGSPVWGSPAGTGDGIKMAQKVGADLWHMDNMAANLGFAVDEFEAGMFVMFIFSMGFICVGNDGRRPHNEMPPQGHGHGLIDGDYELFQRRPLHVIFDEATRQAGPISPPGKFCRWGGTCSWRAMTGVPTTRSRSRRGGSNRPTPWPSWLKSWGSTPTGWRRRWPHGMRLAPPATTRWAAPRPPSLRWPLPPTTGSRQPRYWAGPTAAPAATRRPKC